MKHIQTFESFLNETLINERRVSFKGKRINDLYRIIKDDSNAMIFANGKHFSVGDIDELKNDLQSDTVYLYGDDGEEAEVKIQDIEFIDL